MGVWAGLAGEVSALLVEGINKHRRADRRAPPAPTDEPVRKGRRTWTNPKDALLERLRCYLDALDGDADGEPSADEIGEAAALFSALCRDRRHANDMRTQARLMKTRSTSFAACWRPYSRAMRSCNRSRRRRMRARAIRRGRRRALAAVDLIDVRDRLAAGLAAGAPRAARAGWRRWFRTAPGVDPWREGMDMTLRRLDQALAEGRVTPISPSVGRSRPRAPASLRRLTIRRSPMGRGRRMVPRLRMGGRIVAASRSDGRRTRRPC